MAARALGRMKAAAELSVIFLVDIFSIYAVFRLSVFLRESVLPLFYRHFPSVVPEWGIRDLWWIFLVWIFFFYYEGLYTKRFSFWDEVRALWKVAFFSTVSVFTILSVGKLGEEMSRTVIVLMGLLALIFLPFFRMPLKKSLRKTGLLHRRVLILGAGETGRLILKALRKEPNYGYEVLGFVDDDPRKCGGRIDGVKIHRGIDHAATYIKRCNIEDVFIAMPGAGKERLQGLINTLQHKAERILFVPDIFGIAVLGTNLQHFFHEEAFALEMKNNMSNPFNLALKRCFDLAAGSLLLPALAVPMALTALLIRLDSPGPAIFSQERVGRKGRTFRCYKFRTMHADAEERLERLLAGDPGAKAKWEKRWKLDDDPRVTGIGRFLRTTSLDELPQIMNVLAGDMSLVGPRPVTREEIDIHYRENAELCFSVPPGITGLWQVSGRSNTSYDYRITLDSWYVRNWNLWLDFVILLKTVRIVIKKEGAY
ncbi:MAG: undecaprenyl-phosphate galactose phosphotransferase WbaP [Nitrospiraceae bacterium]|nr:undecaprenyl-phosphate galactose phosphotransferase WbaP [Nitrospiraceae bacterium]